MAFFNCPPKVGLLSLLNGYFKIEFQQNLKEWRLSCRDEFSGGVLLNVKAPIRDAWWRCFWEQRSRHLVIVRAEWGLLLLISTPTQLPSNFNSGESRSACLRRIKLLLDNNPTSNQSIHCIALWHLKGHQTQAAKILRTEKPGKPIHIQASTASGACKCPRFMEMGGALLWLLIKLNSSALQWWDGDPMPVAICVSFPSRNDENRKDYKKWKEPKAPTSDVKKLKR